MRASTFMEKYDVTVDVEFVDNVRGEWDHTLWHVTMSYDKDGVSRDLTIPYRTGVALSDVDEGNVLYCIASDSQSGQMSFREFVDEFGDGDNAADQHDTWEACVTARQNAYNWVASESMWDDLIRIDDER